MYKKEEMKERLEERLKLLREADLKKRMKTLFNKFLKERAENNFLRARVQFLENQMQQLASNFMAYKKEKEAAPVYESWFVNDVSVTKEEFLKAKVMQSKETESLNE